MTKQKLSSRFGSMKPVCLAMFVLSMLFVSGPALSADIFKGKEVFANYCASCHGVDGVAVHPTAPNFQRGEKLFVSDLTLLQSISRGKGAMPSFSGILTDTQIIDVIAYIRTLSR